MMVAGIILGAFLILSILVGIVLLVAFTIKRNEAYKSFVENNSIALAKLDEINAKYNFLPYENMEFFEEYDSEVNFDNVSCFDYMVYQLQFARKNALQNINNYEQNAMEYPLYESEVKSIDIVGEYKVNTEEYDVYKLDKIEEKLLRRRIIRRPKMFYVDVELRYRDMGGNYKGRKECSFDASEVKQTLKRLNKKDNNFYLDREIWDSICRVERAKVSFKIRFSIFKRDHERCCMCGSRRDLEIDHIVPISKGGKSNYSNLQTLCHRCNMKKGDSLL